MRRRILPSLVRLAHRVRARIFASTPAESVDEELDFHVEMRVREHRAAGLGPEEARRAAVERFGDIDEVKAACRRIEERRERTMTTRMWWDGLRRDVGFALRQIRRNPGFAAVVVLTLGLALGANSAVFSVVNGVLLRPLPFEEPEGLVSLWTRYVPSSGLDIPQFPLSPPEMIDYREGSRAMEDVVPYIPATRTLSGERGDPERVAVAFLGAGMFDLLGVQAAHGRGFVPTEQDPGAPGVAVMSHGLWQRRFGGDPAVVGASVTVEGRSVPVVGVMPEGFAFPDASVELWMPLGFDEVDLPGRSSHYLRAVGRLAPGVGLDEARAELEAITAAWNEEFEHHAMGHFIVLRSFRDDLVGDTADTLWLLLAAVGLVLLVACANLANVTLARTETREREMSLRTALGAGRGRLVRQLVTESVVLAGVGAALGLAVCWGAVEAFRVLDPGALPRIEEVAVDGSVLLFTSALALGTALLFGAAPALGLGRGAFVRGLGPARRSTSGSAGVRLRRSLVAVEAALAVVVVVVAGLVTRSLQELTRVETGVRAEGLLTFELTLPGARYQSSGEIVDFYDRVLDRIRGLPGVDGASAATALPVADDPSRNDFLVEGTPPPPAGVPAHNADAVIVRPGYFETMGIPVRRGRALEPADGPDGPFVAVVNQAVVDRYWPDGEVLGVRVGYDFGGELGRPWLTVVGVVADSKVGGLDAESRPQIYLGQSQAEAAWGGTPRTMRLVVRTAGDPRLLGPAVRRAVGELDPALALARLRTMEEVVMAAAAGPRLTATLLSAFGLIALALAVVGIYGVVSYNVSRRTREIGIRRALGADRGRVSRMVVREGAVPAVLGVGLGLVAVLAASGVLARFLFRVSPTDPAMLTGIGLLLVAAAVLASWLPARRATRLQPTEALSAE